MAKIADSQAKMALKAYQQGGDLALLAFIADRTVTKETAEEWIQQGRMQFDDQSSVTQKNSEYWLNYNVDESMTEDDAERLKVVLPMHLDGPRPHPRTVHPRETTYNFVVNPTQLNPMPAWAENLVHQLKDAKTFQAIIEADMTEENAKQLTGKDDVTPFMAIRSYDQQGIYTLNFNEALNSMQELSQQVTLVTKTEWVPQEPEKLSIYAKHGLLSMLDEALGLGAAITDTIDEDFISRWAVEMVAVLQPST